MTELWLQNSGYAVKVVSNPGREQSAISIIYRQTLYRQT